MAELEPGEEQHDYYHFLGIAETASAEEMRRRYHILAMKWHPDRHIGSSEKERKQAEAYMKRLTRAYHVLSTPGLRELYDEQRHSDGPPSHHHVIHAHGPVAFTQMHSPVPPGVGAPTPSIGGKDTKDGGSFGLAILCFLVALSCVSLLFHGIENVVAGSLLVIVVMLFSLGGILFLQDGSILNRAVSAWLNGEPKQFRQDRWRAEQVSEHSKKTIGQKHLMPFELLVEEAMDSIPDQFQEQMGNLMVMVEQEPDEETLERVGVKEGHILLGLYQGVSLTKQGMLWKDQMEHITIYQQTIERYCHHDPERIRAQVRKTVLHEIAHHFGMDHDEMPIWVK